jgi:acylphosphatase
VVATRWVVSGRVQGVGYRWYVFNHAQNLGVRGWVRNLEDGSVEVVALASESTLTRLDELVTRGPPGARVTRVTRQDVPHESVDAKSFVVKH